MNLAEFMEFAKRNDEADYEILGGANAEYAREGNKFENFDTIAEIFKRIVPGFEHMTARHVAIIYGLKHFISVMKGVSVRESMRGRFSDVRNYVRLIEGIDERDAKSNAKPVSPIRYCAETGCLETRAGHRYISDHFFRPL